MIAPGKSHRPAAHETTTSTVLKVRDLGVDAVGPDGTDPIVSSFDLDLAPGETVGIVGESGSGKSLTARAIMGLLPGSLVARGQVEYGGRNLLELSEREWSHVRGREIGFVLQDPFTMLNPVFRCGRIIEESLIRDGRRRPPRSERRAEVLRRLAEVGLTDPSVADRYSFQLSGGMRQRVAVAAALARDPKILIADEPTTALDVTTQKEMLTLLRGVQKARGMSLVLITHDLRVAFAMCDRIHVMYGGSLIEVAPAADLESRPLHPYAQGLLLSEPSLDRRVVELPSIPGSVPKAREVVDCCAFATRCEWVADTCRQGRPPLLEVGRLRRSACVRLPEIGAAMDAKRARIDVAEPPTSEARSERPLIEIRDLRKEFRIGKRTVTALDGVSLSVNQGESVAIVGESGSGKTTLARTLLGLERCTSGDICIDGVPAHDWSKLSAADRRRLRGTVQMVFQDPYASLNPMRSIGSTLSEAIRSHDRGVKDTAGGVADLLKTVGLPPAYAQRKPAALSGGERQRVAIARALAVDPRLLVCDEPVSALDVSVRAQIVNLFATLRRERGVGFIFITHDLSMLRQITERVCIMHRGRLVESGPVDRILDHPTDPYTVKLLQSIPRSGAAWIDAPVTTEARRTPAGGGRRTGGRDLMGEVCDGGDTHGAA
ncbi:dipeptide ABC transporter ATP-binding protein [Embleya hyalina]|uniref:Putative ABC transporter ATP-binding protein n=1 Tax=Embleya hyalina TaxID=516124 RepID=A0A401Z1D0_9ACTN|nr:ABC transporter ATP-binding protein [Embleya hyalina]GCE00648.1 putative ABC transporter ATP-binding protein [Embleya hyalina]